jgi:uncharacterized protein (DUF2141 family)
MIGTLSSFVLGLAAASAGQATAQPECAGRPGPVRLNVTVEGVRSDQGLIALTVYADDSSRFLARRGSLYVGRVPARSPTTELCIYLPSHGVFALGVYHDADGDRRFDRTGIGLPAEGFGFSNNPPLFLSIPSFRSVRLAVPRDNMRTTIRLRYR